VGVLIHLVTYTDLELDVLVAAGAGDIHVDDEDEFVDACEGGSTSLDEAVAARQATDKIVQLVRELREPIASAGNRRLREALMLGLAPTRGLP
jgi:predicted RNA-binding protein associated with RNAse of E/G family